MSDRVAQHIEKIKASHANLNAVLDAMPDHLWEQQIYSEGAQWTVRQLLLHLMISNAGQNKLIIGIANGKEMIPPDYDLERYNKRSVEKQAEVTPEQARAGLAESHQALIAWLNTADETALAITGRDVTLQIVSIDAMLDVVVSHETDHAADIKKLVETHPA